MRTEQETDTVWQLPTAELWLPRDEVHVWRVSLDQPQRLAELEALLAPDERQRAARLRFKEDRDHFVIARGSLRRLLGKYLNLNPADLDFSYSAYGKPLLDISLSGDLRFNLSHSHGLALLAFARGRDLGIDVEFVRRDVDAEQIAEHFFSPAEAACLRALPADKKVEAFFNCWTRKEAFVKARGEGLSLPLDQFDVSLAPGEPAALLSRQTAVDISRWSLIDLFAGERYKAALVVEGRDWRLCCWQWTG